ncbi:MAG: hypothetical protein OXC48_05095, partial [Endozoicomonadaceae bacterium]|nr:hypothetical protein [Endozoicomonadaceae bacterium]
MICNFLKTNVIPFFLLCLLLYCELICEALPLPFQNLPATNKKATIVFNKDHTTNAQKNNVPASKLKDEIKKKLLKVSNTNPWSNAVNFSKNWGTQIDPRTGTFTAYVKVGSMISNLGHGPNINLQISYNSDSMVDADKLGVGWNWNLTYFNPITNQLSTSQGKTFNLSQHTDGTWRPRYHKLHDI